MKFEVVFAAVATLLGGIVASVTQAYMSSRSQRKQNSGRLLIAQLQHGQIRIHLMAVRELMRSYLNPAQPSHEFYDTAGSTKVPHFNVDALAFLASERVDLKLLSLAEALNDASERVVSLLDERNRAVQVLRGSAKLHVDGVELHPVHVERVRLLNGSIMDRLDVAFRLCHMTEEAVYHALQIYDVKPGKMTISNLVGTDDPIASKRNDE